MVHVLLDLLVVIVAGDFIFPTTCLDQLALFNGLIDAALHGPDGAVRGIVQLITKSGYEHVDRRVP
jgi:hypothetical protein